MRVRDRHRRLRLRDSLGEGVNPLKTSVCKLLGIDVPILQAGMATYTSPELVAAVSNAGGLGIIGGLGRSADQLREQIRAVRELTRRPFGVNFVVCLFNPDAFEVAQAEKVPVLSLAWGRDIELIARAHEAGMKVVHQVNSSEDARAVASDGADVVVAQGTEGGGHVGAMSTLPLVPQVVDAVAPLPVLAAGGIADGRGMAAAFMLGAQGVLVGTRFLATNEAPGRGRSKDAIVDALGSQTAASKFYDVVMGIKWPGAVVRAIRSPLLDEWADRPGDWRRAADELKPELQEAVGTGGFVLAGESVGLIHEILPAGEVVSQMAKDARRLLSPATGRPARRSSGRSRS